MWSLGKWWKETERGRVREICFPIPLLLVLLQKRGGGLDEWEQVGAWVTLRAAYLCSLLRTLERDGLTTIVPLPLSLPTDLGVAISWPWQQETMKFHFQSCPQLLCVTYAELRAIVSLHDREMWPHKRARVEKLDGAWAQGLGLLSPRRGRWPWLLQSNTRLWAGREGEASPWVTTAPSTAVLPATRRAVGIAWGLCPRNPFFPFRIWGHPDIMLGKEGDFWKSQHLDSRENKHLIKSPWKHEFKLRLKLDRTEAHFILITRG